jgi:uracil-DNA glycosylase
MYGEYPILLEPSWQSALSNELKHPYLLKLAAFVEQERAQKKPIYPSKELVFNAFYRTPYDKVKVVIVGQDPYHGLGQAHGLCFSVPKGIPAPPSLQNIFKELETDLGIIPPQHGCLLSWAQQGVLLLNATLTVRQSEPMSHHGKGWELFTDAAIRILAERRDPLVFVLWGKSAQEKCRFLKGAAKYSHHMILTAAHPSPLSARQGFFGSCPFSKINKFLISNNKTPINWALPE